MLGGLVGSRAQLILKTGIATTAIIGVSSYVGAKLAHFFMGVRISAAQESQYEDFIVHYRAWQAANAYHYPDPAISGDWRSKAKHVFAKDQAISPRQEQAALANIQIKRERAGRNIAAEQFSYIGEGDQIVRREELVAASTLLKNLEVK